MMGLLDHACPSGKELDLAVRRYFEMVFCDEVDVYIYLLGFLKRSVRRMRVEGEENLKEVLGGRGGILLSAHFGGGFWMLPLLKEKGVRAHFFSADIRREDYPSKSVLYLYHRLRVGAVERASGERVLFKKDGKEGIVKALKAGEWVIVLFDVPPYRVRENVEAVFLNRRARFPVGIISVAKEMNSPVVPFFSYLDNGQDRRICFEKPIYVKNENESVETCVRLIEKRIIERPDHWHFWPIAEQFFTGSPLRGDCVVKGKTEKMSC